MSGPLLAAMRRMVLVAVLVGAFSAHAADGEKRFAVKGAGVAPCSKFIELFDAKDNDVLLFAGWLTGYLTSSNQHAPNTFDLAPWQSTEVLLFLMRDLCGRAPEEQFYRVAAGMTQLLERDKVSVFSKGVEMTNGEHKAVLPREVVKQVQQRLKALNLYTGGVDGSFGPGTQQAIVAFQKNQGIAETGVPDQQTMVHLMYQSSNGG